MFGVDVVLGDGWLLGLVHPPPCLAELRPPIGMGEPGADDRGPRTARDEQKDFACSSKGETSSGSSSSGVRSSSLPPPGRPHPALGLPLPPGRGGSLGPKSANGLESVLWLGTHNPCAQDRSGLFLWASPVLAQGGGVGRIARLWEWRSVVCTRPRLAEGGAGPPSRRHRAEQDPSKGHATAAAGPSAKFRGRERLVTS